MPGLSAAAREASALSVTGLGTWISLHTADPGTTGANEATGGSPAYARKQTAWTGGASDGTVTGSQVAIDVPAGTYTHFSVWTAASSGTFVGSGALSAAAALGAQGQVLVTPTVATP